ncbi:conserved hypothetical protein [Culex quinquefasciatus]|uniref:Uncharacterized protein n=1 Tax=Culex quinquefasciatus TaxID=7176 RepID=B0W9H0_CULQU|nr:conserved hypothetical protein [Culex quinquefasciatus]|eukprot:XP_001845354.1 conserved hypothetical protein [Culex quinquefasciatus]
MQAATKDRDICRRVPVRVSSGERNEPMCTMYNGCRLNTDGFPVRSSRCTRCCHPRLPGDSREPENRQEESSEEPEVVPHEASSEERGSAKSDDPESVPVPEPAVSAPAQPSQFLCGSQTGWPHLGHVRNPGTWVTQSPQHRHCGDGIAGNRRQRYQKRDPEFFDWERTRRLLRKLPAVFVWMVSSSRLEAKIVRIVFVHSRDVAGPPEPPDSRQGDDGRFSQQRVQFVVNTPSPLVLSCTYSTVDRSQHFPFENS